MVLLCCSAVGSEKLHPLIVNRFEKHIPLKIWVITCMTTNHQKILECLEHCLLRVADLFWEENGISEGECSCSVEQCAAHNDKSISWNLLPNSTIYMQPLDQLIICCVKQAFWSLVVLFCCKKYRESSRRKCKKMEQYGWHASCFSGMEIHQNCFMKCGFSTASLVITNSDEENCKWF